MDKKVKTWIKNYSNEVKSNLDLAKKVKNG